MLNDRQKAFAAYYVVCGNATKAAKQAGYSPKTAYSIGNENLKKPEIAKYIRELGKTKQEESEKRIADAQEVLETLTRILRREEMEKVVLTNKHKKEYILAGKKITEETDTPQLTEVPTSIKDALKAAELIGKRYGMFKEKVDVGGTIPVVISGGDELED
ncbi:MAG: terminase small subunit, partial [Clostridiales bacterium]|nr:terminase small subunit [Clostridiales bacterium]